jgi:hypothetical protein
LDFREARPVQIGHHLEHQCRGVGSIGDHIAFAVQKALQLLAQFPVEFDLVGLINLRRLKHVRRCSFLFRSGSHIVRPASLANRACMPKSSAITAVAILSDCDRTIFTLAATFRSWACKVGRRTIAARLQTAGGKRSQVRSATPDMFID